MILRGLCMILLLLLSVRLLLMLVARIWRHQFESSSEGDAISVSLSTP
jgi:hypothetical protein